MMTNHLRAAESSVLTDGANTVLSGRARLAVLLRGSLRGVAGRRPDRPGGDSLNPFEDVFSLCIWSLDERVIPRRACRRRRCAGINTAAAAVDELGPFIFS